jgi:drug/metabolite transporter (DMT)-like permease
MSEPFSAARESGTRYAPLALPVAVAAISFAAIFFKKSFPTHPLSAAGLRLVIAAAVLAPWTIRALRRGGLRSATLRRGALAGVFYGVHFGAWVTSLTLTSIAASVTLVTITPLLLAAYALAVGRDRPAPRHWWGVAAGAAGLVLIGGADGTAGGNALAGDALAVLGAFAMAGYMLTARSLGPESDWAAFSGVATAVGGALLCASALAAGVPLRPSSPAALGFIALAALIPQLVGHNLLTWSLRRSPPMAVSLAVVGEPAGATLLGLAIFGDRPTGWVLAGCATTLFAVIVSSWSAGNPPGEERAA